MISSLVVSLTWYPEGPPDSCPSAQHLEGILVPRSTRLTWPCNDAFSLQKFLVMTPWLQMDLLLLLRPPFPFLDSAALNTNSLPPPRALMSVNGSHPGPRHPGLGHCFLPLHSVTRPVEASSSLPVSPAVQSAHHRSLGLPRELGQTRCACHLQGHGLGYIYILGQGHNDQGQSNPKMSPRCGQGQKQGVKTRNELLLTRHEH